MVVDGMHPKQVANLGYLVPKDFSIHLLEIKHPPAKIQRAILLLLHDDDAKREAQESSKAFAKGDDPKLATELLYEKFGNKTS